MGTPPKPIRPPDNPPPQPGPGRLSPPVDKPGEFRLIPIDVSSPTGITTATFKFEAAEADGFKYLGGDSKLGVFYKDLKGKK